MKPKVILKVVASVLAIIVVVLIAFVILVDANLFKPHLKRLASNQGLELNIDGNLSWTFWPYFGVAVDDVSIAAIQTPNEKIADAKYMGFRVAVLPLAKGTLEVKNLVLESVNLNLAVNEKGEGNWEKLFDKNPSRITAAQNQNQKDAESKHLGISIEKIAIGNSELLYANHATHQSYAFKNINFEMSDVNLVGNPFNLVLSTELAIDNNQSSDQTPLVVKTKLQTKGILAQDLNSLKLEKGKLQIDLNSSQINMPFEVSLENINKDLTYSGKFEISQVNLRRILKSININLVTANQEALTRFNLNTEFAGDKKQFTMKPLHIELDTTQLNGHIALKDFSSKQFDIELKGTELRLDDYLAPKEEAKSTIDTTADDAPLIPVELLRGLNADVKLVLNKFHYFDLLFENVDLALAAKNGSVSQKLNANVYSGQVHQNAILNVSHPNPVLSFEADLKGVEIGPILTAKKLDGKFKLSGALQASASGQAAGNSKNALFNSLIASANFSGNKVKLSPLNVEQKFCQFVGLVNREEMPEREWNDFTELQGLSGRVSLANKLIQVEALSAGVEKLMLNTTGSINLSKGSYDFVLPLKLVRNADDTQTRILTSTQGCAINSNFWVERGMNLLRCSGRYAQINPASDCRPDKELMSALVKDFAAFKIKEKHGEKLDSKKAELIKKLDEKLGGEGAAQKAKDSLKKLFGK